MSSQLQLQQANNIAGQRRWQFILTNASKGSLTLRYAPDGWAKGEVEYMRSATYHGINRNISVNELTFYKDGSNYIQSVYELQGVDAIITLTVNYLDESDYTYKVYHTGKIDLTTYKVDEIGVSVGLIDSDFIDKVFNRDDVEINLNSDTSIDGTALTPLTDGSVNFPDTSINRQSNFTVVSTPVITFSPHVIPIVLNSSDFTETQTPATTSGDVGKKTGSFFLENTEIRTLTLTVSVAGNFSSGTGNLKVDVIVLDDSEVEVYRREVGQDNASGAVSVSGSFNYSLPVGYSLNLESIITTGLNFSYTSVSLDCDEIYEGTPDTDVYSFTYYNACLKAIQLITGNANPFYSDALGLTDSPLTTYASDGIIGFVTRGGYIRGLWEYLFPMSITFKNLFKSLSSVWNLGLAIEKIGGVDKVRIEDRSYFYNYTEVVDLSDRIRTENIAKEVVPDMFYNEVESGYQTSEYLATDGLWEFNTKTSFSTVIKSIKNKFSIISPFRADNQGIRNLLKAPEAVDYDETEDQKGDDDIFMIDALRDGSGFIARTSEGFTDVGGSVYADKSFNLLLTPKRNLLRHGYIVRAGLLHDTSTYLRWQSNDKNTQLYTQLTTETSAVVEKDDILVDDLSKPIWYNEIYRVECYLTPAEKQAIDANPHGLIKLDTEKYGWIKSLKTSNEDGKAEFEIIRAKMDFVVDVNGDYVLDIDGKYIVIL